MYGSLCCFNFTMVIWYSPSPHVFWRVESFQNSLNKSQNVLTCIGQRGFTNEPDFLKTGSIYKMYCPQSREVKGTHVCRVLISTLILIFIYDLGSVVEPPMISFLACLWSGDENSELQSDSLNSFESMKW